MKNENEIQLPSNKSFGYFFTFLFAIVGVYFYISANVSWAFIFITVAFIFMLLTLIKSDALLPLNKLWMHFGQLIGSIVSPIVLGFIFFVLLTPIAILMRLFGRDELRLKFKQKQSHWIPRDELVKSESFEQQF